MERGVRRSPMAFGPYGQIRLAPDLPTLTGMLSNGSQVDRTVCAFIARKVVSNIRELEGARKVVPAIDQQSVVTIRHGMARGTV